jgi:hypothetical protein
MWEQPSEVFLNVPLRGDVEKALEEFKRRLLAPTLATVQSTVLWRDLYWAANEAAALAWMTVCPLLVLPTLLDEKVQAALARWERQEQIRRALRINV